MAPPPPTAPAAALVVAPSGRKKQQQPPPPQQQQSNDGPLESWLRASRAIAGGAAFLVALAGAQVCCMRVCVNLMD
jgi:hypothetical protein